MGYPKQQMNIYLTDDDIKLLDEFKERSGASKSEIIRRCIRFCLENDQKIFDFDHKKSGNSGTRVRKAETAKRWS